MTRLSFSSRWPLLLPVLVLPFGLGVSLPARAQGESEIAPNSVTMENDSLIVGVGERIILPLQGVTRIITDDPEIARASFQNGSPILQGVAPGSTVVEIYQSNDIPRILNVQVSSTMPQRVPGTAPTPVPPPVIQVPVETPSPVENVEPQPDPTPPPRLRPRVRSLSSASTRRLLKPTPDRSNSPSPIPIQEPPWETRRSNSRSMSAFLRDGQRDQGRRL